jgi:hypothetical protein
MPRRKVGLHFRLNSSLADFTCEPKASFEDFSEDELPYWLIHNSRITPRSDLELVHEIEHKTPKSQMRTLPDASLLIKLNARYTDPNCRKSLDSRDPTRSLSLVFSE